MALFQPLLLEYQHLLQISEKMLSLALNSRWEELITLEVDYLLTVEKTTHFTLLSEDSVNTGQETMRQTIAQILENENQIKQLLQHRMNELKDLISTSSQQQAINNTYGMFSGNMLRPEDNA